ncbi:Uncharacterised protein [Mycobacteroides abscessus subsp. massiliense]|nr:hypothetical protein [Mycobacteroides abscessus]SKM18150.1 Uncharacterised protein [Mycobacteroides abscessus subsp. massiliense]MDM2426909.1 hypothetical protein [Mycobacteroides abscessus]MDM2431761.1 hypothetical protein [Mycobacteroides abscessus]MDM2436626.1 hypothetical protein [Mycobacteroides abscessus]
MEEYTHNPTTVLAVQVRRPWSAVRAKVPFLQQINAQSGAFAYFLLSNPGSLDTPRVYEGDWIIKYPTGCYAKMTDDQFQRYYGKQDGDSDGD